MPEEWRNEREENEPRLFMLPSTNGPGFERSGSEPLGTSSAELADDPDVFGERVSFVLTCEWPGGTSTKRLMLPLSWCREGVLAAIFAAYGDLFREELAALGK